MLSSYYLTKYKVLWWAIGLILLAIGFDFKTPAMAMRSLQVRIDTIQIQVDTLKRKVNSGESDRAEMRRMLRDLMILSCSNKREQVICEPYIR